MGSWPSPEEVARQGLQTATAHILDNIGFSSSSGESLNVLTDVMRRFMIELWSRGKLFAEHGKSLFSLLLRSFYDSFYCSLCFFLLRFFYVRKCSSQEDFSSTSLNSTVEGV